MPIKVLMPALSPTMTEGKLAKWLVSEGDEVSSGDVLAEIETDKATMEVEAVDEGRIAKIVIAEGTDNVPVNDLIAILLEEDEDDSALEDALKSDTANENKGAAIETSQEDMKQVPQAPSAPQVIAEKKDTNRVFASPLAKRLANDNGIDLKNVTGSGPNGRIVKADIEQAMKAPKAAPSTAQSPVTPPAPSGEVTHIPNSTVRKVIAKRLTEAKQTIPHFYLNIECNIDALLSLRKQINADATDYKISVNDFIIRAVAKALKEVPEANASWGDEAIIQYNDVDVSVAVASEEGLITPIIRQADQKSLSHISNEMKELAGRAKEGKLKPHEFQGGGFTISNLGMFGIKEFSAIINPPQSCILAVGAGEQRAVVIDGALGIATMMNCTLSVDHRSVDGAVGAQFLAAFKTLIENPAKILV